MQYHFWQGDRIRLRAVELNDADVFARWNLDDETARHCYEIPFPGSFEKVKAFTEQMAKLEPAGDAYRWMAENESGDAVGTINTFACDRKAGTFKYGLAVQREHWGKGYAKEMIRLVLKYYFLELGYQKVTATVYAFNDRSQKLHESLGFHKEGQLRSMIFTNGKHHDEYIYGMLREEYEQLYNGSCKTDIFC